MKQASSMTSAELKAFTNAVQLRALLKGLLWLGLALSPFAIAFLVLVGELVG
jgi:hypothetical protein